MFRSFLIAALGLGLVACANEGEGEAEDASASQTALGLPTDATELGRWSQTDRALLAAEFDAMIEERYAEFGVGEAVDELEAEGFECLINRRHAAECSKSVANRACVHTWSVSIEPTSVDGQTIESTTGGFTVECVNDRPETPED